MSWKFWKRLGKPTQTEHIAVPMTTLFHWYCHDLDIDNAAELALSLGLAPVSEEVAESETKASNIRVTQVAPLVPFLKIMSELNGAITAKQQALVMSSLAESLTDEQKERVEEHMFQSFSLITLMGLIATFSAAFELHLVEHGPSNAHGFVGGVLDEQ